VLLPGTAIDAAGPVQAHPTVKNHWRLCDRVCPIPP
jgi:hypothetical protein